MTKQLLFALVAALVVLTGCSTMSSRIDDHSLEREAVAGTDQPPPTPTSTRRAAGPTSVSSTNGPSNTKIGTGVFVRRMPGGGDQPDTGGAASNEKGVVFNFDNQPVQAVVKAVLGDFLGRNYAIDPNVNGAITFSTSEPVSRDEALPILETLLAWTDNALIKKNGHYAVLPADVAPAGNLTPQLGAPAPGNGMQARLYPLRYISAKEMKKLLKPFAPDEAFLLVDPMRNFVVMAGTPEQLDDYQQTVSTFDVDWLKGMSVGVFTLQHASVKQLMPQLKNLFGQDGSTPLAGMMRFIPIQRTNAIVVITSQSEYLHEVHDWINRIDAGGGNRPQLYVYDVENMRARALANYLSQIYGNGGGGGTGTSVAGGVAPGLSASTLASGGSGFGNSGRGNNRGNGLINGSGSGDMGGGIGGDSLGGGNRRSGGANGDMSGGDSSLATGSSRASTGSLSGPSTEPATVTGPHGIRITAVNSNNQLLVRCRPSQWAEIESAIKRLDQVPLQVQIETRILEVKLQGKFSFGVQWYLQGLAGGEVNDNGGFDPGNPSDSHQVALGAGGNKYNPAQDSLFYSFLNSDMQAAIHAVETNSNTKILSEPSLVVTNNHKAHIQVGQQVPVNQSYIAPGLGSGISGKNGINTVGQVEYKDTGVILNVRPRVNPGGLVYMTVGQEVSKPGTKDQFGNFPIDKRALQTQVAVQSGQTVLLGGLIQQNKGQSERGVPWLSRIPLLGRLFGSTEHHNNRTELLVLITPRVITSSADAHDITQEYQSKFDSLKPLQNDTDPDGEKNMTPDAQPTAKSATDEPTKPDTNAGGNSRL